METSENIIDSTLDVVGNSMNTIDTAFGKIPVYKSGHFVGGKISKWIDSLIDNF